MSEPKRKYITRPCRKIAYNSKLEALAECPENNSLFSTYKCARCTKFHLTTHNKKVDADKQYEMIISSLKRKNKRLKKRVLRTEKGEIVAISKSDLEAMRATILCLREALSAAPPSL